MVDLDPSLTKWELVKYKSTSDIFATLLQPKQQWQTPCFPALQFLKFVGKKAKSLFKKSPARSSWSDVATLGSSQGSFSFSGMGGFYSGDQWTLKAVQGRAMARPDISHAYTGGNFWSPPRLAPLPPPAKSTAAHPGMKIQRPCPAALTPSMPPPATTKALKEQGPKIPTPSITPEAQMVSTARPNQTRRAAPSDPPGPPKIHHPSTQKKQPTSQHSPIPSFASQRPEVGAPPGGEKKSPGCALSPSPPQSKIPKTLPPPKKPQSLGGNPPPPPQSKIPKTLPPPRKPKSLGGKPPPPPPGSSFRRGKRLSRQPQVSELYRDFVVGAPNLSSTVTSKTTPKVSQKSGAEVITEMMTKSPYFIGIERDVEEYGGMITGLIQEINELKASKMTEVVALVKTVEDRLGALTDEAKVLECFEWPGRFSHMREAVRVLEVLSNIREKFSSWTRFRHTVEAELDAMEKFLAASTETIDKLLKEEDAMTKRFKGASIPWNAGVWRETKQASLQLFLAFASLAIPEVVANKRAEGILKRLVEFAYKAHTLAGGFCPQCVAKFEEIQGLVAASRGSQ